MSPSLPQPARPRLREFWTSLPREGKLLLSVVAFEFIGTGLVLPFWVVYLHEVRHFGLDTVGVLIAVLSLAGVAVTAPLGALIDRVGPRRVLVGVMLTAMAGQLVVAAATTVPVATVGIALVGASIGGAWPCSQSMVASVIPSEIRARYFGMNFTLLNLGIGIGGIVGGLVVDVERPHTFELMYVLDAASYLPGLAILLIPLRHAGGRALVRPEHADLKVSYLTVLRQPAMKTLSLMIFASAFAGYAHINVGLPAFARDVGRVSTEALGFAFAVNTAVIVAAQLFVLQWVEGRRRTRVIALMGTVWSVAWLLLGLSGLLPGTLGAAVLLAGCAGVFGFGETFLQPTVPAITNDLAPDHLRGRYNALNSGLFQLASVLGPISAGFLIGHGLAAGYIVLLLVSCAALAWLAVVRLEPQLPAYANGVRAPVDTSDA